MAPSQRTLAELSKGLEVLASDVRLQILLQLREPTRVSAIRASAERSRDGERPERPLSRQTITHHLEQLIEVGLVVRSPTGGDKRGDAYVVNHERVFALVDELRQLNRLRPYESVAVDPEATLQASTESLLSLPDRPRLVEVYGARDGRAFELAGLQTPMLGRAPECDLHVDHDPYVSSQHCRLARGDDGWTVTDLGSSNGTWVNWHAVEPKRARGLRSGDLLRVGRTLFAFQL